MDDLQNERLTDAELQAFFDRLFPDGVAGADVLGEIAPEGWQQSPLLACFHPSVERVFEERLRMHRNVEALRAARRRGDGAADAYETAHPEPTIEDVRREYQSEPVRQDDELTELVGDCLWDIFSDNHDVIVADGRVADIGSFRGASAFLDEYVSRDIRRSWSGAPSKLHNKTALALEAVDKTGFRPPSDEAAAGVSVTARLRAFS